MPGDLCDLWDAAIERVFAKGIEENMVFDFAGPSGVRTFELTFAPEFGPDHEVEKFPEYFFFILCTARTGMRIGEATALQWHALDFEKNYMDDMCRVIEL